MVIFRENTEDIYAGIEYKARVRRGRGRSSTSFRHEMGVKNDSLSGDRARIGIKPISEEGIEAADPRRDRIRRRLRGRRA